MLRLILDVIIIPGYWKCVFLPKRRIATPEYQAPDFSTRCAWEGLIFRLNCDEHADDIQSRWIEIGEINFASRCELFKRFAFSLPQNTRYPFPLCSQVKKQQRRSELWLINTTWLIMSMARPHLIYRRIWNTSRMPHGPPPNIDVPNYQYTLHIHGFLGMQAPIYIEHMNKADSTLLVAWIIEVVRDFRRTLLILFSQNPCPSRQEKIDQQICRWILGRETSAGTYLEFESSSPRISAPMFQYCSICFRDILIKATFISSTKTKSSRGSRTEPLSNLLRSLIEYGATIEQTINGHARGKYSGEKDRKAVIPLSMYRWHRWIMVSFLELDPFGAVPEEAIAALFSGLRHSRWILALGPWLETYHIIKNKTYASSDSTV